MKPRVSPTSVFAWDFSLFVFMPILSPLGTVPTSLGYLSSLEFLGLSDNYLSGQVPSSLCSITLLTYVNIINNNKMCYPACLYRSILTAKNATLAVRCYDGQDLAMCSLASSKLTNIQQNSFNGAPTVITSVVETPHPYKVDDIYEKNYTFYEVGASYYTVTIDSWSESSLYSVYYYFEGRRRPTFIEFGKTVVIPSTSGLTIYLYGFCKG
jgi:hypothetical protein